jgi:hypothetical protein
MPKTDTTTDNNDLEIAGSSLLGDADWIEFNKLRRVFRSDGSKGLLKALGKLRKEHPERLLKIMGALSPAKVLNAMKDHLAETGDTEEDLAEAVRKLQPTRQ